MPNSFGTALQYKMKWKEFGQIQMLKIYTLNVK